MVNPFETIDERLNKIQQTLDKLTAAQKQPPTPTEEKYLSIDQVCQLLGVSRPTLWSWNKNGVLESIRIGNLRRYRSSDIQALAGQKADKKPENEC